MKEFYAWLLLTVSSFQWIGSHICFEVSYFIEVEQQMDELEKAIAEEVKKETGVATTVKILHGDDITPRGHSYSDFFAFSKSIDDQTVFFTIEEDSSGITYQQVTAHQQPKQQDESRTALLKSLYQDFTIPTYSLVETSTESVIVSNFQIKQLLHSFHPSILAPPPDLA